jgi:hypothetical protein
MATLATPISSQELQNCFVNCGRWAYMKGGEALAAYQVFYNQYLAESGMGIAPVTVMVPGATPTARPRRPRATTQQTGTRQPGTQQRTRRVRTAPGSLGEPSAKVLAKIVTTPGITVEGLRKNFARTPGLDAPQRVGVAIRNLTTKSYIAGTDNKTGPFNATSAGIEINSKQPRSITTRPRSRKATTITTPAAEQAVA